MMICALPVATRVTVTVLPEAVAVALVASVVATVKSLFVAPVKAMASIVRRWDGHSFGGGPESPQYKELAEDAYHIADAMLRAREAS